MRPGFLTLFKCCHVIPYGPLANTLLNTLPAPRWSSVKPLSDHSVNPVATPCGAPVGCPCQPPADPPQERHRREVAEQDFERASKAAAAEQARRGREQSRLKEQQEVQQRLAAHRQGACHPHCQSLATSHCLMLAVY